ncbi:LCP family protein, partial [Solibacillus silvestris]|uniref:LCP family protein n=1 Tax=Solibacillus silvestris TaxID=76853 RepID=UPI003F812095
MEDKRLKGEIHKMYGQELNFTKEDRDEVFEQIRKSGNAAQKRSFISSPKKSAPLTISLLVIGLCIFLFIQPNFGGNANKENSTGGVSEEHSTGIASGTALHEKGTITTLLTVKDDENRIPLNLLFTYSKDKKKMKVLSLPRDTYAPVSDNEDGTASYSKLTFAYKHGSGGAENVRATVSKLVDAAIDYYAVVDLETFSALIDSADGIAYNLQEDIQARAISKVSFEFKKGANRLNGEEVVSLLMDAAVGRNLNEEDQSNLINAIIHQSINVLTQTQLKQFTEKIEGNIPVEQLLDNIMELPPVGVCQYSCRIKLLNFSIKIKICSIK